MNAKKKAKMFTKGESSVRTLRNLLKSVRTEDQFLVKWLHDPFVIV